MKLKVKGLSYSLAHKQILNKLNLEIKQGRITAILGANGSGKSTLLRLIAGLLDPEAGEITFHGDTVLGPKFNLLPGHPEISLVKQDFKLFPLHTVRENLQHAVQSETKSFQSRRISEVCSILDLSSNLDRTLKYLSGGEQQRVALAAALAAGRKLLLMDEPFSQTDMYLKHDLKKYLQEIASQEGIGILFVTHDPQDALGFADEIMVMDKGKIVEKGNSKKLYYQPKKMVTAILTGYCNWLPSEGINLKTKLHQLKDRYLVRPDQIEINPEHPNDTIAAKVERIGFFGMYEIIHLALLKNNLSLIATQISNSSRVIPGQPVTISFKDLYKD